MKIAAAPTKEMQGLSVTGSSHPATAQADINMLDDDEEDIFVGDGDFQGEEEDVEFIDDGSAQDAETNRFDQIVGALEDILMDPEFEDTREAFCKSNCKEFEDNDENKLSYTVIFSKYTEMVEAVIESKLKARIPGFDMGDFMSMLGARKDELMSDVFDLLVSLADFETFKEVMLSYKRELEEGASSFQIKCTGMKIHSEEQEDGEERPDLDMGLQISPVGGGAGNKR
mmetsp:Transcript_16514/g.35717  ORF Transcript_16514/g.35717 Transcript_16514/m.35717 type:complete len:228 (+) Transcript_16514:298-981(+)|eukprot:CAMPEP_0202901108 /NCGR_PEP_ID=MMETSP1392-20130828/13332_1 /ASSEMBLY_ACC=CAM_ASM_000868 /TAXON_ID=225041 /ORGANISM="Chlamydomonas chlamydogama, Strain SAG 11-48b" /LENGTH=227 /DNA_ID=CAMNT_0049587609 /DNA_START=297 /DNA_END=980 /DNA_ORIENTATION=+